MNKVTVIVPNYNGKHFLAPCLDALKRQSMADFDITVVDNGSIDGSVEFLKNQYPYVKVIELSENKGFCVAVNEGVKAAKTEYVLLLNNDTIPEERFVEALTNAMDKNKKAFSCGSCMLTVDNPDILDGAGDLYCAFGWASARGKGRPADKFQKQAKVFSACAGAAIYRRDIFVKLGMLDEAHFAYLEDMDLGYRARINGYENLYIPQARVLHVGSGTSGSRYNDFKVRYSARNNVYLIYKNMPIGQRILNSPLLALGFAVKSQYFKRKGFGRLYKDSLREGKKLALSREGRERRVPFKCANLGNYLKIQFELWGNIFKLYR